MLVTVLEITLQLHRLLTANLTQLGIQLHALLLHALHDLNLGPPLHRFAKSDILFLKADPKDHSQTKEHKTGR